MENRQLGSTASSLAIAGDDESTKRIVLDAYSQLCGHQKTQSASASL